MPRQRGERSKDGASVMSSEQGTWASPEDPSPKQEEEEEEEGATRVCHQIIRVTKPRSKNKNTCVHVCEISFSQREKFCEVSMKRKGQVPLGIIVSIFPTNLKITKHRVIVQRH